MPPGLREIQRDWEAMGTDDPLHAILNDPKTRDKRWKAKEFFLAGNREIEAVFLWLESRGAFPRYWEDALDFGCGVGRLTQALAKQFHQVIGVDIAASMLDTAKKFSPPANCRFVLNESENLKAFESETFDLVYSSIVLQHMPPELALNYIAEFGRILRPGGVAVFQIPVGRKVPLSAKIRFAFHSARGALKLGTRIREIGGKPAEQPSKRAGTGRILMYWVPEEQVLGCIEASGLRLMAKAFTNSCDREYNGNLEIHPDPRYHSHFLSGIFAARK